MPTLPTVDVVVPCYNYARYLPQCVNSVLTQPGVEVRVTVIDDCSSDESAEVAARLALDDSRVRFVLHEVNRGHLATYVEGLDAATADYVVLLSADDLLTPGALGRATGLMQAHPNVGFVYGYPIPLYDAQLPAARTRSRGWSVRPGRDWIANMCESGRNLINCPEVVMRTSVQHAIGHFSPTLPHSGDMEMWMRAAAVADVGHLRGVDQAYYRIHNRSMQRTTHAGFLVDLKGRLAAFESAFAGGASRVAGAPQLLATARRALAIEAVERAAQAIEAGRDHGEPIAGYLAFATELHAAVVGERVWMRLERARRRSRGGVLAALQWGQGKVRQAREHLAWRHWRETGLY